MRLFTLFQNFTSKMKTREIVDFFIKNFLNWLFWSIFTGVLVGLITPYINAKIVNLNSITMEYKNIDKIKFGYDSNYYNYILGTPIISLSSGEYIELFYETNHFFVYTAFDANNISKALFITLKEDDEPYPIPSKNGNQNELGKTKFGDIDVSSNMNIVFNYEMNSRYSYYMELTEIGRWSGYNYISYGVMPFGFLPEGFYEYILNLQKISLDRGEQTNILAFEEVNKNLRKGVKPNTYGIVSNTCDISKLTFFNLDIYAYTLCDY